MKYIFIVICICGVILTIATIDYACGNSSNRLNTISNFKNGVVIEKRIEPFVIGAYEHHRKPDTSYYLTIKHRLTNKEDWYIKEIKVKKFEFNNVKEGDVIR